jgi:hypothetical protein
MPAKKFKKAAVVLTAVEAARQWAHNNPEKAGTYIDKAGDFVDKRTQGKYHSQIDGLSARAKSALTGTSGASSASARTVRGETTQRPFPDMRA